MDALIVLGFMMGSAVIGLFFGFWIGEASSRHK